MEFQLGAKYKSQTTNSIWTFIAYGMHSNVIFHIKDGEDYGLLPMEEIECTIHNVHYANDLYSFDSFDSDLKSLTKIDKNA